MARRPLWAMALPRSHHSTSTTASRLCEGACRRTLLPLAYRRGMRGASPVSLNPPPVLRQPNDAANERLHLGEGNRDHGIVGVPMALIVRQTAKPSRSARAARSGFADRGEHLEAREPIDEDKHVHVRTVVRLAPRKRPKETHLAQPIAERRSQPLAIGFAKKTRPDDSHRPGAVGHALWGRGLAHGPQGTAAEFAARRETAPAHRTHSKLCPAFTLGKRGLCLSLSLAFVSFPETFDSRSLFRCASSATRIASAARQRLRRWLESERH